MEAEDMRLESAVLQLNPARTRCELMVRLRDGEEQSLGTGLVETFANHLGAIRERILGSGSSLINLQPASDGEDSSWFTKDTFERFLEFVNSPEVLERAVGVRDELSRLMNLASLSDEGAVTREELEARRCMLEKEVAASGFTVESVRKLQLFASKFGDAGLLIACENYMADCTEERMKPEGVDYMSSSLNQVSASVLSKRSGTPAENGVGGIATGAISDRRLSVQEKISMFERTMGAGLDGVRRSIDGVDRLGVQKPVLRRWSLAESAGGGRGDPTSRETEAVLEETETGSSSGQQAEELKSRASHVAESGNQPEDCASPLSDSLRSLFCPLKATQKLSGIAEGRDDDQNSVASDTQSLADKKGRLYDEYRQRRDAKLRDEPGLRREERQAKLKKMQETLERRRGEIARAATKVNPLVEAQVRAAKLRAFKAGLLEMKKEKDEEEKRRLEALRLQRQKQAAAALPSPRSPHSGASTPRTGITTKQMKGFLPTFQRAASTGTNNSTGIRNPQASLLQQQQQQQQKLPAKGQKNATQATVQPAKKAVEGGAAVSKLRKPTCTAALRKSLSSLTEAQGLKLSTQLMSDAAEDAERSGIYARRRSESFKISSSSATTEAPAKGLATAIAATAASEPAASSGVIRARVTLDDDDVAGFGDEFRPSAEEETEYDEEAGASAAIEYNAPIAPVSVAASPMLLQGS